VQLAEKFRRGVVVPLDDESAATLRTLEVAETTRVHYVEINDQATFEAIWRTGIFDAVGKATGCIVEDYDEEEIPAAMVARVCELSELYASKGAGGADGVRFFNALAEACKLAQRDQRSIYFIL
jgi:hypothetical protein